MCSSSTPPLQLKEAVFLPQWTSHSFLATLFISASLYIFSSWAALQLLPVETPPVSLIKGLFTRSPCTALPTHSPSSESCVPSQHNSTQPSCIISGLKWWGCQQYFGRLFKILKFSWWEIFSFLSWTSAFITILCTPIKVLRIKPKLLQHTITYHYCPASFTHSLVTPIP